MGRIILVLCLLISSVVSAQPGYTNINARYKWIAGGFDSSLILPRYNGVPSGLRSAWNTDGQLAVDTANNHLYVYSGGAWVRIANYSDVGSTYTFPYSVVAPGSAIQLENDTTANPANYFYGRNSAGRRGWYPQSGIAGVNLFNSDGTLTGDRTVDGDGNDFSIYNANEFYVSTPDGNYLDLYDGGNSKAYFQGGVTKSSKSSYFEFSAGDVVSGFSPKTIFEKYLQRHPTASIFRSETVTKYGIMGINTNNAVMSADTVYIGTQDTTATVEITPLKINVKTDTLLIDIPTKGTGKVLTSDADGNATWETPSGGISGITVGTTTITSGTNGRIAYNNAGIYGEKAVTGTGDVVLATSPTLVTPNIGVASGTSLTLSGLTTRRVLYNNDGLIKDTSAFTYSSSGELLVNTTTDLGNYNLQVGGQMASQRYDLYASGGGLLGGLINNSGYMALNSSSLMALLGSSDIWINAGVDIAMSPRVAIGSSLGAFTATARLHIVGGTATANTAPLKFTSGTNLTTAEAGAMEYNGTNFFLTPSSAARNNILMTASVNSVSPTSPDRTITVVIDGTTYYIHAKTTND